MAHTEFRNIVPVDSPQQRIEELMARRKPLLEEFEKNPHRLHFYVEIKLIDDQVAECTRQIRMERSSEVSRQIKSTATKPPTLRS